MRISQDNHLTQALDRRIGPFLRDLRDEGKSYFTASGRYPQDVEANEKGEPLLLSASM